MIALVSRRPPRALSHGPSALVGAEDASSTPSVSASEDVTLATTQVESLANLPNLITLSGYASTLAWLAGAPGIFAVYGLVADEADGRVARELNQTSNFGSLFDWAVDITLTGLVLSRLGWTWLLVGLTPLQVYLRNQGYRPTIGSARAGLTLYALLAGR